MAAKTATAGTIQTITGETLEGQSGSSTVKSAANTVIHHRLKRPGRGWTRDNAQAMLAGLSELHSGRFDRTWQATLPLAV